MKLTADQLTERRRQLARDLAEIETQVAAGELDAATASRLTSIYEQRNRELDSTVIVDAPAAVFTPRRIVGVIAFLLAIGGVIWLVANSLENREPGQFVTGNLDQRNLEDVTTAEMEEVVAQFPEVVGMRLALARRYFVAGDFSAALPHYLAVLEREPDDPEANANIGWMTFLSDPAEAATAATFVERSLEAAPNYGEAIFFLANIRLYGQDDRAAAAELLSRLEAIDLPADVQQAVDEMLEEIEP